MKRNVDRPAIRAWFATALMCVALTTALAEENVSYEGRWLVKIALDNYRGEADVVVRGNGGTYQRRVPGARPDPCAGREMPIVITKATPDALEYRVMGSKALAGCPDGDVVLKRMPDGPLEGTATLNGARMTHLRQ